MNFTKEITNICNLFSSSMDIPLENLIPEMALLCDEPVQENMSVTEEQTKQSKQPTNNKNNTSMVIENEQKTTEETASVASNIVKMNVSDEEKEEV